MSGLLFLENDDFVLSRGVKGNILCTGIPNFSILLFYSTSCQFCKNLIPIFRKLPPSLGGVKFGMLNVSTNKNVIRLSKDTVAPIEYVPYIVFYVNGRPFMKYTGPHTLEGIKQFVIDVAHKIENKQKFSRDQNQQDGNSGSLEVIRGKHPEFSLGIPIIGNLDDEGRYKEFQEAYENKVPLKKQRPKQLR